MSKSAERGAALPFIVTAEEGPVTFCFKNWRFFLKILVLLDLIFLVDS